ncbi:MAG: carbohydrate ABC transporter permease [Anaerocolumna sp.]
MAGNKTLAGKGKGRGTTLLIYIILLAFIIVMIIPIFWGLMTSFKGTGEISRFPPTILPDTVVTTNYYKVLFLSNFTTYFKNSCIVTFLGVIISTIIAGHAAYAIARFHIKFREQLMYAILMTSMVPAVALLIPLYIISVKAGIYNTRFMIILVYTAWRTPMLTWILKGFFDSVPQAIEEAAMIDGCSRLRTFYTIVLPMSQPGIVSSALLTAVYVWNDFLVSFTFVTKEGLKTVSVGLYSYITQYGVQWGELLSAVMITIIPIIILFICLQRKFVDGMAAGAVKG